MKFNDVKDTIVQFSSNSEVVAKKNTPIGIKIDTPSRLINLRYDSVEERDSDYRDLARRLTQ